MVALYIGEELWGTNIALYDHRTCSETHSGGYANYIGEYKTTQGALAIMYIIQFNSLGLC